MRAIETALGLSASEGPSIDAGAGARGGLLVVADGIGGHCTGWLSARLAVRTLCEQAKTSAAEARYVGAADEFPDQWGWAGAIQSRRAAVAAYDICEGLLGDRAALPRELSPLFVEIDRAIDRIPEHMRISGLFAGCIAVAFEGKHLRGAHAGVGRALLLRSGGSQFESLVQPHYLHEVIQRHPMWDQLGDVEIPPNVIANGLGGLSRFQVGVDLFEADLEVGDVLVMCSARLGVPDDELARIVKTAVESGVALDEIARRIEDAERTPRCEPTYGGGRDLAFALAMARPEVTS